MWKGGVGRGVGSLALSTFVVPPRRPTDRATTVYRVCVLGKSISAARRPRVDGAAALATIDGSIGAVRAQFSLSTHSDGDATTASAADGVLSTAHDDPSLARRVTLGSECSQPRVCGTSTGCARNLCPQALRNWLVVTRCGSAATSPLVYGRSGGRSLLVELRAHQDVPQVVSSDAIPEP